MNFRQLHQQEVPLLLCNVWDVASANIAEKYGFKAIGTSSSAIASTLGQKDGEEIGFLALTNLVQQIVKHVDIPVSVDMEAGYSRNPKKIAENILQLAEYGIQGINLEDSIVGRERTMIDPKVFAQQLIKIKQQLDTQHIDMFINVRTDPFLLSHPNALNESIHRAKIYQESGADGIFVPCVEDVEDIAAIVEAITLPLNVMCMPKLPGFEILATLGVKRMSMGNFFFERMKNQLKKDLTNIIHKQSFQPIFGS